MNIFKKIPLFPFSKKTEVWHTSISASRMYVDKLFGLLAPDEQMKAYKFIFEKDRVASIVSRGVLRILLAVYIDWLPEEIEFRYSKYGKPYLSEKVQYAGKRLHFNVSHSNDCILFAFGYEELGIDIELITSDLDVQAVSRRVFSAEESELIAHLDSPYIMFYELWTRKEAYLKAIGTKILW